VPLALLWSSYEQQGRRGAEARLFAELARGQAQQTGRSSDVSAQVVVTAAARLLGGADVELVLLAADGPVRYSGDETGLPERRRVGSAVLDEPWVLRALGEPGVRADRQDGRPSLSAVLGNPDAPLAVLRARRGVDATAFDRDELRLAQVLVGQAHGWLSVADLAPRSRSAGRRADLADEAARALSDLGPATAPSLLELRESADRLARLAEGSAAVDDIVEELHLAERAVASLIGAGRWPSSPSSWCHPASCRRSGSPTSGRRQACWRDREDRTRARRAAARRLRRVAVRRRGAAEPALRSAWSCVPRASFHGAPAEPWRPAAWRGCWSRSSLCSLRPGWRPRCVGSVRTRCNGWTSPCPGQGRRGSGCPL
jgi:hypothetical protein